MRPLTADEQRGPERPRDLSKLAQLARKREEENPDPLTLDPPCPTHYTTLPKEMVHEHMAKTRKHKQSQLHRDSFFPLTNICLVLKYVQLPKN